MPLWYPVINPGNREYTFDLPQRIRARFLSEPRSLRDDFPDPIPGGGITLFDFADRGTGYVVGDIVGVTGGNNDVIGRVRVVDADTGALVALDLIAPGTGYSAGEAAVSGGSGVDGSFLILEVA